MKDKVLIYLFVLCSYFLCAYAKAENIELYKEIYNLLVRVNDSLLNNDDFSALVNNTTLMQIDNSIDELDKFSIKQVQNKQVSSCETVLISTYLSLMRDSFEELSICFDKSSCKADEKELIVDKVKYLSEQVKPLLTNCGVK